MRINFATAAVLALGAQSVAASTWFSKAAYNKWHETELERWLSDHDVPYPTPADRKDLVDLVKNHWDDKIVQPYNSWDTNQLQDYIASQGQEVKKGTEQNKDSLISQVKSYWHETADQASDAYSSVQDWVFDSWTDSQLKAFLDYHGIPNPSPRTRDTLLHSARSNYQSVAKKTGETAAYPGNWLYQSWSDSDLKAWLDERGIPAPQPSTRDKLIASLRRNSRLAANQASKAAAAASASAAGAQQSLSSQLLDSWSDSQLKQWFDKNGIKVPQGSRRNELIALARKHSAKLSGDNVSASASSAYGQASKSAQSASSVAAKSANSAADVAGSQYASATDSAYGSAQYWFDWAKAQVGIGGEEAKSSLASVSSVASVSASSASSYASSLASASGSSGYSRLSNSAGSASGQAAASASSASKAASKAAGSAADDAASSVKSATDAAAKSASSASSAAGKNAAASAKSATDAAGKSASSAASVASKSASSGSKAASSAAEKSASSASKSGSSYAKQAADAVSENASSAKHKASEAAQKATDRVKEEL